MLKYTVTALLTLWHGNTMSNFLTDVLHITPLIFTLLALTALTAGLARGFSGFGAALIFVPIATRLLGPQIAAPLLLLTDGFVAAPLVFTTWSLARKNEVFLMSMGALVGIPLGTVILSYADPLLLRWAIVVIVVVMLGLLVSGWRYSGTPHRSLTTAVGAFSGVLSGISQIGGPPVVAYLLGSKGSVASLRASTILYFAIASMITLASYLIGGLITRQIVLVALALLPFYSAGLWAGSRMFGKASDQFFRRICFALIALSVLISLPVWD
jgi:uncharacterized protein